MTNDSDALSPTNNIEGKSLNSIENILTSIENMFKPSLSDLASSHGVKLIAKMFSDEFKNVISDHLCKGRCLSSTFKGCMLVTLTQTGPDWYTEQRKT